MKNAFEEKVHGITLHMNLTDQFLHFAYYILGQPISPIFNGQESTMHINILVAENKIDPSR